MNLCEWVINKNVFAEQQTRNFSLNRRFPQTHHDSQDRDKLISFDSCYWTVSVGSRIQSVLLNASRSCVQIHA
jgi:hypothetical protein